MSAQTCVSVSDGMRFPLLNGQCSSPPVGSMEDDSHCMSFAQVGRKNTHTHTHNPEVKS